VRKLDSTKTKRLGTLNRASHSNDPNICDRNFPTTVLVLKACSYNINSLSLVVELVIHIAECNTDKFYIK
jgi:hypothetical protein